MVGDHQPTIHPSFGAIEPSLPVRRITPAELRVLQLVARGLTSRQIAEGLWVSRQAVTYHIGNLFMKLRADTRAGLVARAYAVGILAPGTWPPAVDPGYLLIAGLATRSPRLTSNAPSAEAPEREGRSPFSMEAG